MATNKKANVVSEDEEEEEIDFGVLANPPHPHPARQSWAEVTIALALWLTTQWNNASPKAKCMVVEVCRMFCFQLMAHLAATLCIGEVQVFAASIVDSKGIEGIVCAAVGPVGIAKGYEFREPMTSCASAIVAKLLFAKLVHKVRSSLPSFIPHALSLPTNALSLPASPTPAVGSTRSAHARWLGR
jgi:hypothetical protein